MSRGPQSYIINRSHKILADSWRWNMESSNLDITGWLGVRVALAGRPVGYM